MRSTLRALLLTCLVLGGSSEARADLGIPTDGLDLVELTDGRVLRCVVTGRDGEYELKFASATVVVPEERVREVRYFKDFDPEPANDEEKAQVARGLIRWKGRWVKPEVAAARRKKEEEASRKQREEDEAHALWVNRRHRKTKHFQVESNVTGESLDFFVELLEDYYDHFTKYFRVKLTQRERKKKLPVFIFGNREDYWKDYEADTGGEAEHTLGYFVPVPGRRSSTCSTSPEDAASHWTSFFTRARTSSCTSPSRRCSSPGGSTRGWPSTSAPPSARGRSSSWAWSRTAVSCSSRR